MMNSQVAQAWNRASIDDEAESECNESKEKNTSQLEHFFDRKDLNIREKGWSQMNRIVGKGNTSNFGVEDIMFYYNGGPKAMREARKAHVYGGFDTDIVMKMTDAEIQLEKLSNTIVDKATKVLCVEDGAVFNKIRVNRNLLEKALTDSKNQLVIQNRGNETSHAIVVNMENRYPPFMVLTNLESRA